LDFVFNRVNPENMAVPKKRGTKSKRDKRRLHHALKEPSLTKCPKCGVLRLSHTVCHSCGYYKGREVIDVLAKLDKKERKKKEKEMQAKEETEPKKKSLNWKDLSKK